MSRHRYDCRVRFSDVDVFGHVNNVKYFEYYQEARLVFLSSIGRSADDEGSFALVVARVEVDYKRPILFRTSPYVVETWVTGVGGSSFTLSSEIRDVDQVLSRARTTLVTFDSKTQKARPLRDPERQRLQGELDD